MSERVHRSVMNIKVGLFFYILSLFLAFFSRRVFLDSLGTEFIGLTGMLMNIMTYLSVVELGIGMSIVYFLYKPLQENNHERINEVMSMLAFLYRCIGLIIGGIGVITSFFFPWWFGNLSVGLPLVYFAFYSFLFSSISAYIFNYKQLLVGANQKQYLVNAYFQTISIAQSLVQISLAYYYRNLWLWVAVGLIFTIIGIIVFNYRIKQLYPWLNINLKEGYQNLKRYPEVLKKTRQVFIQKIKDLILYHSDEILIGMFVSVIQVAYYGNYLIIINKLNYLVNILSEGLSAGIGNLLAEGNEKNIMKIFWELTAARFFILGIITFSLLMFLQPFIGCWLGKHYQLDNIIIYLLIFCLFIRYQSAAVYIYLGSAGLFSDVWAAWTELIINLSVTILLAPTYGIIGILLGKIISYFFISVLWKPYYLFSQGFHKSVSIYWRGMAPYYIIFASFTVLSVWIKYAIINQYVDSVLSLVLYGAVISLPLLGLYFIFLFSFTTGMKFFIARKPAIYNILIHITFLQK
ncbi:sugar transporter [uncultured Prevotella sp.]|uniref:lipopolysaccharide biosynthesis protein n=1 Tax=uncultured Prevotella sp. TaxID=159272 RepID=UPI00258D1017|nr:sugar transporter [uncultured Prevotella sp.]